MNALVFALITTASVLSCVSRSAAQDIPEVLQGMRLLPDYRLQPLQGMDSIVGQISKPDGLTIRYEIGRIPKPGRVGMGGDFSDQPLLIPAARREWYKEQTIGGEPVHVGLYQRETTTGFLSESWDQFYDCGENKRTVRRRSTDCVDGS